MPFKGWRAEALEFFEGLEADNSKTYWTEHKRVYDELVRAPMNALLAELAPEFGAGKVFRPYRDVRFSSDKSPYKTAIGARVGPHGYVQLSSQGLAAGSGMWEMAPDQLDRYRRAVAADDTGQDLADVIAAIRKAGSDVIGHGMLKTAPKGYAKDHPRVELLRYKGIAAWREWPAGAWLGRATARNRVVEFLRGCRPLNEWLAASVGPSTLPPDPRR